MTASQARAFAEEFAGIFLPALPPSGWESLIQSVLPELDAWTDDQIVFADSLLMPEPQYGKVMPWVKSDERGYCQAWFASAESAIGEQCDKAAAVSDLDSGLSFCVSCWKRR